MAHLTLLLPPLRHLAEEARSGELAFWISRGDRLADVAPGRDTMLRESFEFVGTAIPFAALTRSLDSADAAGTLWLRADPAWVAADAVTLRLLACGNMDLSPSDSEQLARALKPLFGDAGFLLEATLPSRWYLRCPPGATLPQFSTPQAALGDDVARHLPDGDAGRRWQHLLNEAQVILHNHPLNAERSRRGLSPVNSLWFWGAGMLPDWVRATSSAVVSNDEIVHALARLAKVPVMNTLADALAAAAVDSHILVDADASADAAFENEWQPMQRALTQRVIRELRLSFASGERYLYRHGHRWRFWRKLPAKPQA
ncbi:MAG TPA: phosphoglycerate mutase [Rudaea sp.]|nr:phosphoglycerate mutase [Rudaea sp.]